LNEKKKKIRVGVSVDPVDWERFLKIAKANESDGSKEIRKFIKRYIAENAQLLIQ